MEDKGRERALSIKIIIMLAVYIGVITDAAILLNMEETWNAVLWFVIVIAGLVILFTYHSRHVAFICKSCGSRFEITPLKDFLSPHSTRSHYLKCPQCGKRAWDKVVPK
ncbi:MAG: hypothetical protein Q8930_15320 [Bacillota bacterium]|nr:hypothetical protein [Bacillota bacterium]